MYVLTTTDLDETIVLGVFDTVDGAKDYANTSDQEVKWSNPDHNIYGNIWTNYGPGYSIEGVEVNPKR